MKTRMTTWMPTLWMDSANLGLTLPLRVPFKELFLLFGKWFGSRILRLLSWSPISLKMERYVVKKNLLEMFKYCRKTTFTPHIIMSFSWHMIEVFALLLFFFQPKCDLYWPDSGTETYGDMLVSLLREDILASYTLRTFSIRYMKPNVSTVSALLFWKRLKNHFCPKRIIFQMFFLHSFIYFSFHFFSICRALWKRKWLP